MRHYTYKLNSLDSLVPRPVKLKKYPFNEWGAKPVVGILTEKGIVRTPVFWTAPLLFETEAENIMEADQAFLKATGIKVSQRPDIGCAAHPSGCVYPYT